MRKFTQIMRRSQECPDGWLKGLDGSDLARAFYETRYNQEQFDRLAGLIVNGHEEHTPTANHTGLTGSERAMLNLASVVVLASSDYFEANGKGLEDTRYGFCLRKEIPTSEMILTFQAPPMHRLCGFYGLSRQELSKRVSEIEGKYKLRAMN